MLGVGIAPKLGHNPWWSRGLYLTLAFATVLGAKAFVDHVVIAQSLFPNAVMTRRVSPIPVSAAACVHVPELHSAAATIRAEMNYAEWGYALPTPRLNPLGLPATPVRMSWPSSRLRLRDELRALDVAIMRAAPTFPVAVQASFVSVRRDIAAGLPELARSRSIDELLTTNGDRWSAAVQAFGSASDLVGAQCGTPLGAGEPLLGPCAIAKCSTP